MNILSIVKTVAGVATAFGAGSVVGNAISASTPKNLKLVSKVVVAIGGFAISAVAGELASKYIEEEVIQNNFTAFKAAARGTKRAKTLIENGADVTTAFSAGIDEVKDAVSEDRKETE